MFKQRCGNKVYYKRCFDDREEANFVASEIKRLNDYKETAILYRSNYQSRRFEEILIRNNIPYVIKDSLSFYSREEIKDLMAYLKFIVNSKDVEAFTRIINVPKRGIGPSSVKKILDYCSQNNISIYEAFNNLEEIGFKGKTLLALSQFLEMFKYLKEIDKIDDIFVALLEEFGYKQYLTDKYKSDEEDLKNKLQNIQELRNVTYDYIRLYSETHPEKSKEELEIIKNMSAKTILSEFLDDLSLRPIK